MTNPQPQQGNPFGRWTQHRARLARLSRSGFREEAAELEARQLMKAALLADAILVARDQLTAEERERMADLLTQDPQ